MNILIIRDKTQNLQGGIKKHSSDLYYLFKNDGDINIQEIKDLPCKYIPILRKHIVNTSILKKYIQESLCETIHIHGFMSFLVIQSITISSKLKKRIIYSPHFHPFKYLNRPFLGKVFFILLLRPLLKKIDTIITINNEDTLFFTSKHNNVQRIPHWIDENITCDNIVRKNNMILFVGRNDSNKGLEHLYALPKNKYEIHCVTNGTLKRDDFIQHTSISNNELKKLYREASVVVVPSRYEAFSLVALEALYNHTPIVISNRVRIGDYLSNSKNCQVFSYGNYKDFERAIDIILKLSNQTFDESILQPFSVNSIKNKYKSIYLNEKQH